MNPTLLLVDDEPAIVEAISKSLADESYIIYKAGCAAEALNVLEHHSIDVVITDQSMPGMTGTDLCATVHQRWPSTYRILLSSSDDSTAEMAEKSGDIHQAMDKPWDALQLRYNISEGIRQQQVLEQAVQLQKTFQQTEQAFFITDKNWVISIANGAWDTWLSLSRENLEGLNLFSHQVSNNSIEVEAKIMASVERSGHWQGTFQLHTDSVHGNEAWMVVVPLAMDHYLCMAIPLNSGMAQSPRLPEDDSIDDQVHYLLIDIDHNDKANSDLSTIINEHIQMALHYTLPVHTTSAGQHLVRLQANLSQEIINRAQQEITHTLEGTFIYQGDHIQLKFRTDIISQPLGLRLLQHNKQDETEPASQNPLTEKVPETEATNDSQYHTYYLPQSNSAQDFSCRPLFNQHGKSIGLIPSICQGKEAINEWLHNILSCQQEWIKYCDDGPVWMSDFTALKPHQVLKAIAPILILNQQNDFKWWIILNFKQLDDMVTADKKTLFQLSQSGISFMLHEEDHSITRLNELTHSLAGMLKGICYQPQWLVSDDGQINRHARHLLMGMKQKGLTLFCREISEPRTLATIHETQTHWLSGDILSAPLTPTQICWLHQ